MRKEKSVIGKYLAMWLAAVIFCFFCAGCAAEPAAESAPASPQEAVQAVLTQMLAGPDEETAALAAENIAEIGIGLEQDEDAQQEAAAALQERLAAQYAAYFTTDGLQEFLDGSYSELPFFLYLPLGREPAPTLTLHSLQLEESGTETAGAYRFQASALYQLGETEEEIAFQGYAYLDAENRISRLVTDEGALLVTRVNELLRAAGTA